jgi:integrase
LWTTIADVRIHDLRHSFASFLVNAGRSLYEVQKILGHTQVGALAAVVGGCSLTPLDRRRRRGRQGGAAADRGGVTLFYLEIRII